MIFVRVDANELIGTGHIMRCLSIARVFVNKGEKVVFITADHKGDSLIYNSGFSSICLESDWSHLNDEIMNVEALIKEKSPTLLLLDSYYVTDEYFSRLSKLVKTVYIDDLNTQIWKTDVLINYNIFSSVFDYTGYSETKTKLMLSPKYTPLREEFLNCKKHEIKEVSDIFVSAGGSDPEHITERIIKHVCPKFSDIRFHFIVGALNPRLKNIEALANLSENIELHVNEQHMSDLMKACDIAISAAGVTLYELCACGIPTITYTLADNQLAAAEQFYSKGIMLNSGDCRGDVTFIGRLSSLLSDLIFDNDLRLELSTRMQELVDGKGADRIVDQLL